MQQTTIARAVEWRGIGLHSGKPAAVAVLPAALDSGLVFVALDASAPRGVAIPVHPSAVHSTSRATTLAAVARDASSSGRRTASAAAESPQSEDRPRVATVEHLLAALYALGIHNARIEVSGGEIPALDGSAAPFSTRLSQAGLRILAGSRRELAVTALFRVGDADRWIQVEPAEGLQIDYSIDFAHPFVGRQRYELTCLDPSHFETELAPARTFGFAAEVDQLHAQGLARGGDLSNTLVIGEHELMNPGGLRWPDELVRHKVVDLLGDLALLGGELHARITVEKGGHGLHHALVRALVERSGLLTERAPLTECVPRAERTPETAGGLRRAASQPG